MAEKEIKPKVGFNAVGGGKSKGLSGVFEMFSKMTEAAKEEYHRNEGTSGLGDNVKLAEVREPIVDIFDEGDYLMVITELPDIRESDIHLEIKGDILDLKAEREDRKYRKKVPLPVKVEAESVKTQYKNGIVKIKLDKKTSRAEGDK